MTIQTPIHSSSEFFGIRSRSAWREEAALLKQEILLLRYRMERMERREQERQRIRRIEQNQHSRYFTLDELSGKQAPAEQVSAADISLEDTQILIHASPLAGEEDYTSSNPSLESTAPIITTHTIGENTVQSFSQALASHERVSRKPANVIYTNGLGRLVLYLRGVKHMEGIEWRCSHMLADEEILCVTEEGDHVGKQTLTTF